MKFTPDVENLFSSLNSNTWYYLIRDNSIPEDFIRKFKDKIDWSVFSRHQNLDRFSDKFIHDFHEYIRWDITLDHIKLNEDFIEKFRDYYFDDYKKNIICYQDLSPEFIKKNYHLYSTTLELIFRYQSLPEDFIEEYYDKKFAYHIFAKQNVSINFIEKHINDIRWDDYYNNRKVDNKQKLQCSLFFKLYRYDDKTELRQNVAFIKKQFKNKKRILTEDEVDACLMLKTLL